MLVLCLTHIVHNKGTAKYLCLGKEKHESNVWHIYILCYGVHISVFYQSIIFQSCILSQLEYSSSDRTAGSIIVLSLLVSTASVSSLPAPARLQQQPEGAKGSEPKGTDSRAETERFSQEHKSSSSSVRR